jgi:hypothetical protein
VGVGGCILQPASHWPAEQKQILLAKEAAVVLRSAYSQHQSKTTLQYDVTALGLCMAMLVLAMVIGHYHQVGTFNDETDFYGDYAVQAQRIVAGQAYTYQHHPPGYVLVLAAVSSLTGDFFVAGKIISAFAAALFCWITYLLVKALFDSRIALVAMMLLCVALIPFSFLAQSDLLAAAAITLSIWVVLRQPLLTSTACFFAGISAGVAYLVRAPAVFVILGLGFSLLYINLNNESFRLRLQRVSGFICGVLLITSPWIIINWKTNGSPYTSPYLQIAAHFYNPERETLGTSLVEAASRFHSLSDVLLLDPPRVLSTFLQDVLHDNLWLLTTEGIRFPAFLFTGAGFLLLVTDFSRRRATFIVVCLLGYLLSCLVGFSLRYYFFLFPLLFVSVAYFFFCEHVFIHLGKVPFSRVPVSWLIVISLAGLGASQAYRATRKTIDSEPRHLSEIARFLRDRSSPDDRIFTYRPHIAFLSGLRCSFPLAPPPQTANEYLVKAREAGVRYVVYSQSDASLVPGLESLSKPDAITNDFKLVYRHAPTLTLVYEIECNGCHKKQA